MLYKTIRFLLSADFLVYKCHLSITDYPPPSGKPIRVGEEISGGSPLSRFY